MTTEERATPRPTCTDHCARCGQHFHGLGAFDAHRQDGVCVEPAVEALRRSKDGFERPALQVWTAEGWCKLWGGCYENGRFIEDKQQHPVVIYQVATTEAQREALAVLQSKML